MDKLIRLSSDERDNLTAYLDGELDDDATRIIEAALVQSPVARRDVEQLAKTYDLLDELPTAQAPADFLERTMATARLDEIRAPLHEQPWFRTLTRSGVLMCWSLLMLGSTLGGYALTTRFMTRPEDTKVNNLPLLRNLDVYEEVHDLEFLEQLSGEEKILDEMRKVTSHEQR